MTQTYSCNANDEAPVQWWYLFRHNAHVASQSLIDRCSRRLFPSTLCSCSRWASGLWPGGVWAFSRFFKRQISQRSYPQLTTKCERAQYTTMYPGQCPNATPWISSQNPPNPGITADLVMTWRLDNILGSASSPEACWDGDSLMMPKA